MAKTIFFTLQILVLASCGFQRVSKSTLEAAGFQSTAVSQLPVNFDDPHPGYDYLVSSCSSCHNPDNPMGNYVLPIDNPIEFFDSKKPFYIVAGNSANSPFMNSLNTMPYGNPAGLSDRQLVAEWIDSLYMPEVMQGSGDNQNNNENPDAPPPSAGGISFTTQILPILQAKCTTCHSAALSEGGVRLDNFENFRIHATSGVVVASLLDESMPPAGPSYVTDLQLTNLIILTEQWIQEGSPNN